MEKIHEIRKAIVAAAGVVVLVLNSEEVSVADDIPAFLIAIATVVLTYAIPNRAH